MKFLFLFLFFPFCLAAQPAPVSVKQLTGLWQGYITTAEAKVPYELVFSELNGSLIGWSYTTFTVKDAEIVTMKKVSVNLKDGIIVEDDENIYNNFPSEQLKKIKQTNKLSLEETAGSAKLIGTFKTQTPRNLKPARGMILLEKKNTPDSSVLIAKLTELDLTPTLSFSFNNTRVKEPDSSSLAVVEKNVQEKIFVPAIPPPIANADTTDLGNKMVLRKTAPLSVVVIPYDASKPSEPAFINKQAPVVVIAPVKPMEKINPPAPPIPRPDAVAAKAPQAAPVAKAKVPVLIKKIPPPAPVAKAKVLVPVIKKAPPAVAAVKATPKPLPVNVAVAAPIDFGKREIEIIDQLSISADSLQFTLYDNGDVDGDTVSIIMNGKTIVSRQGLTAIAFTKTIYLTPDMGDSVQIIMYAENLGAIAPNTGLMILNYDKQRREVRFSGDLSKNAAITLRRKRNE